MAQMLHDDCPGCAAPDLAFAQHDHAHCAHDALARAEALIAARGLRLTPVRRRTLEILLEAHRAMGAYDMLTRLAAEGFGNQPPVAYRALDFLEEQGLAHRIRRLNAFTACMHPGEAHAPAFLICRACDTVAEAPAAPVLAALTKAARHSGFVIERSNIEALGLCHSCQEAAA
jgi:Fur family zinc uptake transcriptional regulator